MDIHSSISVSLLHANLNFKTIGFISHIVDRVLFLLSDFSLLKILKMLKNNRISLEIIPQKEKRSSVIHTILTSAYGNAELSCAYLMLQFIPIINRYYAAKQIFRQVEKTIIFLLSNFMINDNIFLFCYA